MKGNREFARFGVRVGGVISSCSILVFLFRCCFRFVLLSSFRDYVAGAKTRGNTEDGIPAGRDARFLRCGRCIAPKACRIGPFFFAGCTFVTLLSHCPYFSRFPSVLICLFQREGGGGGFRRGGRRYAKILADSQKFVGFRFICKTST